MAIAERLRGERVTLRLAGIDDGQALTDLINSPGVVEWWTPHPYEDVLEGIAVPDETYVKYCIDLPVDGGTETVGLVQYGQELDPQYFHASIDIAVLASYHRCGIATDAIRTLAQHLIDDLGHHRIVIDPAVGNAAAIACYSGLGFRPVGVMRSYERGVDGSFHDGLLMDLLAGELT